MTRLDVSFLVALAAQAALGPGCQRNDVRLRVLAASDLVPYEEVDRIETELVGVGLVAVTTIDRRTRLDEDSVVFDRSLAPLRGRHVRVTALRAGAVVVTRDLLLDHLADREIRVLLTRACENVECGSGGTCVRGGCAPTACIDGSESGCPAASCSVDLDCPGPTVGACAAAGCRAGTCLVFGDDDACGAMDWCDPDEGCVPRAANADAGVGDGGVPDAGVEHDAAVEDATVEDATAEDATVEDAAVEDAAVEDAAVEDAAVEDAATP